MINITAPVEHNLGPLGAAKLATRGGGGLARLAMQMAYDPIGDPPVKYKGAFWNLEPNNGIGLNLHPPDWTEAAALAANRDGVTAGFSDDDPIVPEPLPARWDAALAYRIVKPSGASTGQFRDVDGRLPENCVGMGVFDGVHQGIVWNSSNAAADVYVFDDDDLPAGYIASEANAINDDGPVIGLIGGQVFGGTSGNTACVWTWNGLHYDPVLVSSSADWAPVADRSARVVSLYDTVPGDPARPYAVGWVEASGFDPGRPFVWSLGSNRVKFGSPYVFEPLQASNRAYTPSSPVVSFVGRGTLPYIYVGSPDPTLPNDGVECDLWAFLHPYVPQPGDDDFTAANATGLESAFVAGGVGFSPKASTAPALFRTTAADTAGWELAASPTQTLVRGTVLGGSTNDLAKVEGRFATIEKGPQPNSGAAGIILEVEGTCPVSVPVDIALRTTARADSSGLFRMKTLFWDWDAQVWFELEPGTTSNDGHLLQRYMSTPLKSLTGQTNFGRFVQNSDGRVRARVEVRRFLSGGSQPLWTNSFEQCRILVRPSL
ncbi:MAG: hypothetical protein IT207_03960 [Fimbriimonadaceae bacterium]|nr:hypothetical protein [Fimbriimonadaceae bacterium]